MICIDDVISKFRGITLSAMDGVKLMNRTDRKYWFNLAHLAELLEAVKDDYYILEIEGVRNMLYSSIYYDTTDDEMYSNHHRGKLNRYKIRRRNYILTKSSFLEVKFKSNKGRTVKVRQPSNYENIEFDADDKTFIHNHTPYSSDDLRRVLESGFRRLMLVSMGMNERCTIDSDLRFVSQEGEAKMDDLVVVEVKTDGKSRSRIIDALNQRRIKPSGFSKYCMGRSITESGIKRNNFKCKHREIEKKQRL